MNTAYETLAGQVYPWELPFNLWEEEARVYLEHLGVPRYRLMETFQRGTPPDPSDIAFLIAADHLRLSPLHRQIIAGTAPQQPWEFWGLEENNNQIVDPTQPTEKISGNWVKVLSHVGVFLQRSELSYTESLELLDTRYINKAQALVIESTDPEDPLTCDVAKLAIKGVDESALSRINRFSGCAVGSDGRSLSWTRRSPPSTRSWMTLSC